MKAIWLAVVALLACGRSDSPPAEGVPAPTPSAPATATAQPGESSGDAMAPIDAAATIDFNERVLELVETYEPGGGYAWPAPRGTHGTTRDLLIEGERFARASGGPTHCSGLTFEIFWRALESFPGGATGAGLDPAKARKLMRLWFVPDDRGQGPARALAETGLGRRIENLDNARPGDFVQVWMNNDRGHTMIFFAWQRDPAGRITGIRHFSTHPATNGIGITTRAIGEGPRDIDREQIYIGRGQAPGS